MCSILATLLCVALLRTAKHSTVLLKLCQAEKEHHLWICGEISGSEGRDNLLL
jgi:hypothetical protein